MKTRILFVFAVLLLTGAAARSIPPGALTVAVYDFSDADKNGGGYGAKVAALVTAELTTETNFVMVERSDLNKALGEQAIGISGIVNSDQAAKIGQITGAKVFISGQVIKISAKRIVVVANIVGTETGRLFAEKAEGAPENLTELTSDLSRKIAQNIRDHTSSFVAESLSHEDYLERIVKSAKGTNRPSVSVIFRFPRKPQGTSATAISEMSILLQKAGFKVVDDKSEQKPEVEITGVIDDQPGPKRGGLFSCRTVIELKVQERRTGNIIAIDRQVADAVDVGRMTARRNSEAKATDGLAERLLPLLVK